MQYYVDFWKRYVDFKGRTSRKAYWMAVLFNFLVAIGIGIVDGVIGAAMDTNFSILSGLFVLATIIPGLAMAIRRFHDQNRSGWFILLGLVPFIGGIIVLIFMLMEGTEGKNDYGDPQKEEVKKVEAPEKKK